MKNRYLYPFFIALLSWAGTSMAQQQPIYVLRPASPLGPADAKSLTDRILRASLGALHNSTRADVVAGEGTADAAATHLLETHSQIKVLKQAFEIKKFIDSTQTVVLQYEYEVKGKVEMLATSVETGLVVGRATLNAKGEASKEFKLDYKRAGWAKGMNTSDDKLKQPVLQNALDVFKSQIFPVAATAKDKLVKNIEHEGRKAHYLLFPFRATVTEATEASGDKAKTIRIAVGSEADLLRGDDVSIYTIEEISSGNKQYEHFKIIGRASVEKMNEKDGLFDVKRGKKEILEALKAKQTVYASPGTPYTVKNRNALLNLAVAAFLTPGEFTHQQRNAAFLQLRFNLLNKQGFNLLARENMEAIQAEKELQKQGNFIDKAVVDQYKSIGADLVLEVVCDNLNIKLTWVQGTRKVGSADVSLDYTLRLISVETGEVVGEKKVPFSKYYSYSLGIPSENDEILDHFNQTPNLTDKYFLNHALQQFNINPAGFLDEILPPKVIVAEVTEEKKNKADEVLVVGDFDFERSDKWNVARKRIVNTDGKELVRFETIGTIALREAEGAGVANAKVKDGGEQILAAMKAGELLYVMDKLNWAEKWNANYLYKHGY